MVEASTQTASPQTSLDDDLRALARQHGLDPGASGDFSLHPPGGHEIRVRFTTDGDGDPLTLSLVARYTAVARSHERARSAAHYRDAASPQTLVATRPLGIELRREDAGDVHAKATGVSVEWESGHAAFDDAVYVTSPTRDQSVLGAVLNEDVREATLTLLSFGVSHMGIDTGEEGLVEAVFSLRAGDRVTARPEDLAKRATQLVDAFERLLLHLPSITATGARHEGPPLARLTMVLGIIGALGWLLNVGYLGLVVMALNAIRGKDEPVATSVVITAIAAGIAGGVIGAVVYGDIVRARARGRPDAHRESGRARLRAFGGFSILTFTVVCAVLVLTRSG